MITYFDRQLKVLEDCIHSMDMDQFSRLVNESVDTLEMGHKIVVSGLGKNVPICEKFFGSMVSLGLDACFMNTNSAIHGDLGIVKDGDLVILLTKSGETNESIYLARLLRDRKVNLWLLTFSPQSTLAREIPNKLILRLETEGDLWNIMPNNSATANLIVLQGLAVQIADRKNITLQKFKQNHPGGAIGKMLNAK